MELNQRETPLTPRRLESGSDECRRLAGAIAETPETVISRHLLLQGLAQAIVVGATDRWMAVGVQSTVDPSEPCLFGDDGEALWSIARAMSGWRCLNAPRAVAPILKARLERETGRPIDQTLDLYHTLTGPVRLAPRPVARRLGVDDVDLVARAPALLQPTGWPRPLVAIADGFVAGAVVDDALRAIAWISAHGDRYGDLAVATAPEWHGGGLATTAAALVANAIRQRGLTPVWSVGERNAASRRVAQKLGFQRVSSRVYLIPR